MAKRIQVGGRIESKEVGGIVTGAAEILDDAKGKKQSVINGETDDELLRLNQSKQDNLTFDNAPTEGSDNPVKSGGVYAADKALSDAIEAILLLIPSAASALNKLVDTATMNSSISTATATFKGTYNVVTDLSLTVDATHEQIAAALGNAISTADNNDYAFVQIPVSAESTDIRRTERYKFNGTAWGYEYDLNTSGFTAAQWAAINSGITLALVGKLIGLPTSSELQALLGQKQDTLTFDNVPTAGSANPVKSGGVHTAINDEKTAREQLANTVTGINGRLEDVEEVIPTGAAVNNKLVANNSMEAYVTSIIEAITASFTIATADGHINLTLTQTNGRVASLTLTSSDIASAQALTALTDRVSTAENNITTLGGRMITAEDNITSIGGRVSTNETDIANLQQLYNNLQKSKPVPVTALPSTGQQQGVIYRLAGTTSYSDYMWNGSTWVLMATYNNAIDDEPTAGSDNLVKSGGVYNVCGKLRTTSNLLKLSDFSKVSATRELGLLLPNGTVSSHNSQYVSSYIEIEANCEYYAILPNVPDWTASLAIYDSSYNPIYVAGGGSGNPIPKPFELLRFPGNAKYIRFFWTFWSTGEGDIYIYKCNKALGVTYDSSATKNSTNLINSGAVYESITKSNPELIGFESLCRNIEDFEIIDPNKVNGLLYKDGRVLESTEQKVSSLIEIDVVNYDYVSNVSRFAAGAEFASIVVYDADENILAIYGGDGITSPYEGCLLKLPTTAKYIRHFATWSGDYILKARKSAVGFDNVPTENSHNLLDSGAIYTALQNSLPSGKKVLWLGTSIPEGSPYPQNSCTNSGYTCINKAIGSSHLEFYAGRHSSYTESSGRFLTATVAELEALYRPDVESGLIQESWLTNWKNGSYENIVLPYINGTNSVQVDAIVIDHGINDGNSIVNQIINKESIDWNSDNRETFTGAFKYLVDKIWAVNPNIRIIVCGYFEDEFHKTTIEGIEYNMSKSICEIQEMIAEYWNFPIMKGWKISGISNRYVPNSASYIQDNYIDEPPKIPGNYYPRYPDANGNITIFQYYCPDGLHPHSDKTDRSAERLTLTYTKLLKNLV